MIAEAAAFILGLSGSGHCLSMCGPLVLYASGPRAISQIAYHAGRVMLYTALGVVAGATGAAVAAPEWRNGLAIVTGLTVLFLPWATKGWLGNSRRFTWLARPISRAVGTVAKWVRRHHVGGPLVFGALNGLLPCGWLYVALGASAGLADPASAARFMMAFGAGTVPALVALRLLPGRTLNPVVFRRAAPWASVVVGLVLIARGLNAGAPSHVQQHGHAAGHTGPVAASQSSAAEAAPLVSHVHE